MIVQLNLLHVLFSAFLLIFVVLCFFIQFMLGKQQYLEDKLEHLSSLLKDQEHLSKQTEASISALKETTDIALMKNTPIAVSIPVVDSSVLDVTAAINIGGYLLAGIAVLGFGYYTYSLVKASGLIALFNASNDFLLSIADRVQSLMLETNPHLRPADITEFHGVDELGNQFLIKFTYENSGTKGIEFFTFIGGNPIKVTNLGAIINDFATKQSEIRVESAVELSEAIVDNLSKISWPVV